MAYYLRSEYGYVFVENTALSDLLLPAVAMVGAGSLAAALNVADASLNLPAVAMTGAGSLAVGALNLTDSVLSLPAVAMTGAGSLAAALSVASAPPPGSPLAWYDYTDVSTLYQAIGLSTPTTANGQAVKSVTDLSGNGRHQENASGVGTREAAGFAVPVAVSAGLLCPSMTFTAGHTIFVICDANAIASGFVIDTRDSPTNYIYRAAPFANVGGYVLGDSAYFTGLTGHRCLAMRTGSGIKPSIWRAGTKYAEDPTTLGTVADVARVWSLGQLSVSPWNEPAATTYKGMLVYSGALSDVDMAAVSAWAAARWGLLQTIQENNHGR